MPYMSDILSNRDIQPGTENTGVGSEDDFSAVASRWAQEMRDQGYNIRYEDQPRELMYLFGDYGVRPEGMLILDDQYVWFFEVKYQKDGGNAQERVYRLFTPGFQDALARLIEDNYGYCPQRHPYSAIFTGSLAVKEKFRQEFETCLDQDSYVRWGDVSDSYPIYDYLNFVYDCLYNEREEYMNSNQYNSDSDGYTY